VRSHRFTDLQKGLPLISPSLLSTRPKELEAAGVIYKKPALSGKGAEY
jgi:DNA-binding HxlR family transcriptional regulator